MRELGVKAKDRAGAYSLARIASHGKMHIVFGANCDLITQYNRDVPAYEIQFRALCLSSNG